MNPPLQNPLSAAYPLTSPRGWRTLDNGRTHHWHSGIDIAAPVGTSVMVAAGGIVLVAGDLNDGFGLQVIVQHLPHLHTRYAHLHSIACKVGDRLAPPQLVGTVGNTGRSQGAHLHLDVMCDSPGYMTDLDPLDYLAGGWTWALSGLVPGSTGPRVRALQQLINRTLRPDRLKVDGVWGGQTTAAIRTLTAGEATVPALLRTLQR